MPYELHPSPLLLLPRLQRLAISTKHPPSRHDLLPFPGQPFGDPHLDA
jgi:hypothetical protein